jgi:hypothetical protein
MTSGEEGKQNPAGRKAKAVGRKTKDSGAQKKSNTLIYISMA